MKVRLSSYTYTFFAKFDCDQKELYEVVGDSSVWYRFFKSFNFNCIIPICSGQILQYGKKLVLTLKTRNKNEIGCPIPSEL